MDVLHTPENSLQQQQQKRLNAKQSHTKDWALCLITDGNVYNANSNMTWFYSPIKSTDTNCALFPDKS